MLNTLKKEYFVSCDELTVFRWQKCLDGDLTHLRRKEEVGTPENDSFAWWEFMIDYYEVIGFSDDQKKLLDLKEKYTYALCEMIEADDSRKAFLSNAVNFAKDDLDFFIKRREQEEDTKNGIIQSIVKLQDVFKVHIDEFTTTVLKYHALIEEARKKAQNGKAN